MGWLQFWVATKEELLKFRNRLLVNKKYTWFMVHQQKCEFSWKKLCDYKTKTSFEVEKFKMFWNFYIKMVISKIDMWCN